MSTVPFSTMCWARALASRGDMDGIGINDTVAMLDFESSTAFAARLGLATSVGVPRALNSWPTARPGPPPNGPRRTVAILRARVQLLDERRLRSWRSLPQVPGYSPGPATVLRSRYHLTIESGPQL